MPRLQCVSLFEEEPLHPPLGLGGSMLHPTPSICMFENSTQLIKLAQSNNNCIA